MTKGARQATARRVALSAFLCGSVLARTGRAASDECAASMPSSETAGVADPFHQARAAASVANEKASLLYRQQKWEEAKALYREALREDPSFLAPRLNLACAFVRQERWADAAKEVVGLLHEAYVPWSREIAEAADLGALRDRPEMKAVDEALTRERMRWTEGLGHEALFFVGRSRAPVRMPVETQGVFILGLRQEAFAYLPARGVYRQLSATDGRLLALLPSSRSTWLAVVTGEKLVRMQGRTAVRGLTVEHWELPSLRVKARWRAPFDVERLALWERGSSLHVAADGGAGVGGTKVGWGTAFRMVEGEHPVDVPPPRAEESALLVDGAGAHLGRRFPLEVGQGACRWQATSMAGAAGTAARIELRRRGSPPVVLAPPHGATLGGFLF
jgi:hypothetical protein